MAQLKGKLSAAQDGQRRREDDEAAKRKAAEEELRVAQVEMTDIKARLAAVRVTHTYIPTYIHTQS